MYNLFWHLLVYSTVEQYGKFQLVSQTKMRHSFRQFGCHIHTESTMDKNLIPTFFLRCYYYLDSVHAVQTFFLIDAILHTTI